MVDRDAIIRLLKTKGPLVSNEIRREVGGDNMLLGAVLSELKGKGALDITKIKKGGSPFYYLPESKEKLEPLIEFLNPKDQQTVRRLKEEKVISEANEELFVRVSFRNVPDFAQSFMMQTPAGEYRFWRYFLVSETQAREVVRQRLQPPQTKKEEIEERPQPPEQETRQESARQPSEKTAPRAEAESEEKQTDRRTEHRPDPTKKPAPNIKRDEQSSLTIKAGLEPSPFYEDIITYLEERDIRLHKEEQLSKDREYTFIVTVPTAVGPLKMYAHARNKKKLTEGDAAPALLNAKQLDLPCLFVYTGSFTKKGLRIINKDYNGILLKKL